MKYKYTLVSISLPDWESGSVTDMFEFNNPEDAFLAKEDYEEKSPDDWFDIIIEKLTSK